MKYRLLAPGPTPVPDRVLKEMNRTIIHHRTEQFEQIFSECKSGLAWLLDSKSSPLMLTCSGTGAFEASVQNFFNKGDVVLCVTGGKFAENWLKMAGRFGLCPVEIPVSWGDAVRVEQVEDALKEFPAAKGVVLVASETSTGVRHPYREIGELVKMRNDCLFVVDGVTAVGVFDIAPERDNIDVLVAGSQKGLMLPPGLGFVWVSDKAWQMSERSLLPKFYFDLQKEKRAQAQDQTGHTPAVSLIMGLRESLSMMREEGKGALFERHIRLAHATREGLKALGLKLMAQSPSEAITSAYSPKELPQDALYRGLMELANFTIAGGQGNLAGKIFRIGHMGYVDDIDILGVLSAVEIVLKRSGLERFTFGDSIKACAPILEAGFAKNK